MAGDKITRKQARRYIVHCDKCWEHFVIVTRGGFNSAVCPHCGYRNLWRLGAPAHTGAGNLKKPGL